MPETSGRTVPHITTATTPSSSRFCRTNAPSRDTAGAGFASTPRLERNVSSSAENRRQTTRKPKNHGPMALIANVCTDGTTPLRTMKVPNTTSRNAVITSPKFHKRKRPLLSWTCEECR